MTTRSSAHIGRAGSAMLEQLEQRLMLAVDPVSGMSITADTVFNAGTFTLTAGITIDADNVTVSGAGQGVTIIKLVENDSTGVNMITVDNHDNVTIEDMTIDGQRTIQSYVWSWGATEHWDGIWIKDSNYVTIQDMTIQHMGNNGILVAASVWNVYYTDIHVYDVTVTDNGHLNTSHLGGGVWMTNSNNSSIQRSTANSNGYHGLGGVGDNFQILDSFSYDNLQGGFVIKGTNSTIDNNVGDGNGQGIYANGIDANAANVISNNILTNSVQDGINIYNDVTDPAYANIVVNNTIIGTGATGKGIYSPSGDYHIIRNNYFDNVGYGVFLNGVDDAVIENNTIYNAGFEGLHVEGYRNSLINNTVTNNNIGIDIRASDTFLFGNRFLGSSSYGIKNSSGSGNSGDENTAGSTFNWNDDGTSGATYSSSDPLRYDFNGDWTVDDRDIDLLSAAIRSGSTDHKYDMDGFDDAGAQYGVTWNDHEYLVTMLMGKRMGDADLNGIVDTADWAIWNTYNGTSGHTAPGNGWSQADFDGDGDVDGDDLTIWGANEDGPVPANTVSVTAIDPTATEAGTTTGTYRISRTGPAADAVTVYYMATGTADSSDYVALSGQAVMGIATNFVDVTLTPIDDAIIENSETVILVLLPIGGYSVGTQNNAIVTIEDNATVVLDPVVWLKMDESSGTIAYDETSNNNDATVTNATYVTGNSGNALDFDGTGDYAVISNSASVTIGDNITIAFWVKGSSQPDYERMLSYRTRGGGDGIEIEVNGSDGLYLRIDTSGGAGQGGAIADVLDGTWHHLAYTLSSGTFAAYLDGSQVTSAGTLYNHGSGFGNTNDWVLAANSNLNEQFNGTIDDFRIYDTALTALEIESVYAGQPPTLPTVTIIATGATATEEGTITGTFTVTRTGDTSSALTVNYSISGTAANGGDYTSLGGSIVIPAGNAFASITVTPTDDYWNEGDETVVVTLASDSAYTVGAANIDIVTIADNDVPAAYWGGPWTAEDIDLLAGVAQGSTAPVLPDYDLDGDGDVDLADRDYLITMTIGTGYGDADLDLDVDVDDLILWKSYRFTTGTGLASGDFDGDGDTDVDDLILWKSNRFTSYPGPLTSPTSDGASLATLPMSETPAEIDYLSIWNANRFQISTTLAGGDLDGDGDTDIDDLNLWKASRFTSYNSVVDLPA